MKEDINNMSTKEKVGLIIDNPVLIDCLTNLGEFTIWSWIDVLKARPELADKCDKFAQFTGYAWCTLLCYRPEFADRCDFSKLDTHDWAVLIANYPELADRCGKWDDFSSSDWVTLLYVQPQFADKCDKWDQLEDSMWTSLLLAQPQLVDRCVYYKRIAVIQELKSFDTIAGITEGFDEADWYEVFDKCPELATKELLENSSAKYVSRLVAKHEIIKELFCVNEA